MSSSSVLQKLRIDNLSDNEIIRNLKEIYLRKKTFCEMLDNKTVIKQFMKLLFHSNRKIAVAVIEIMYAIPSSKCLKHFDRNDVVMEFKRLFIENENETLTVKILTILHKMSAQHRLVLYKLHTFGFCSLFLKFTNYHLAAARLHAKTEIIEKMFQILLSMFSVSERQRDMLNDGLFSTMVQIVTIYVRDKVQNVKFIKAIIIDFHWMFRKLQCPIGGHANVTEDVLDMFVDLLTVERVHCSEVFSHFCKLSSQKHTQQMKRFVKFYMDECRKVVADESNGCDRSLDETNLKIVQRFFEHIRFYETDRILDESDIDVLCALVRRSCSLTETILIYKLILAILRGFGDLKRNSRTKLIETLKNSFEFWLREYAKNRTKSGSDYSERVPSMRHECFAMLDWRQKQVSLSEVTVAVTATATESVTCENRFVLRLIDELANVLIVLLGEFRGIIATCDLELFPDFLQIVLKWIEVLAGATDEIYLKVRKICHKFKSLIFKRKLFFDLDLLESFGFYAIFAANEKCPNCRTIRELLRMFRIDLPTETDSFGVRELDSLDDYRLLTVFYLVRVWNAELVAKLRHVLEKYETFDLHRLFLLVTFLAREFCEKAAIVVVADADADEADMRTESHDSSFSTSRNDVCKLSFANRDETLEIHRHFLIEQLPYYRVLHDGQFETKIIDNTIEVKEFSFEATKLFFELLRAGGDRATAIELLTQRSHQLEIVLETLQFADFHNKCNLMNILLVFIDRFCSQNMPSLPLIYNYAKHSGLTALRSIAIVLTTKMLQNYRILNSGGFRVFQKINFATKKNDDVIPKNVLEPLITAHTQTKKGQIYDKKPFKMRLEAGKTYSWCTCGQSHTQPLCDKTHQNPFLKIDLRPVFFQVAETKEYWLCNCKQTKHRPFCDGSHKKPEIQEAIRS